RPTRPPPPPRPPPRPPPPPPAPPGAPPPPPLYQPVRQGSPGRPEEPEGLHRRTPARRAHHARHTQPPGLPHQAHPEGQAPEEDRRHRRRLRQRQGLPRGLQGRPADAGDLLRRQGQGERGGVLSGGKNVGPTRRARPRRPGTTTRRLN